MYRALGFPPQFFTVLFAVPRIVGYVSHWRESLADPDVKIMRPQQDYRVRNASRCTCNCRTGFSACRRDVAACSAHVRQEAISARSMAVNIGA